MIPAFAALDAAVALFKRFRTLITVIPLLTVIALLWVKLYGFLWWDGAIEQRDKARAQVVQMEAASKEARAKQIALNTANQELSQRIAADESERTAQIVAATNNAIADYANRNRLRKNAGNCTSGDDPSALPSHTPGIPESGEQPDLVAIPRDEFETLARKAVQDDRKTSFLIELVNNGLAVPLEYPEPKLSGD